MQKNFVPRPPVAKNDGVELERGVGDYALIINILWFECITSKEIYLKRTYSYVLYLSYLIILRNQCSRQNQCTAKTRSRYLEGPNIKGPYNCSTTV